MGIGSTFWIGKYEGCELEWQPVPVPARVDYIELKQIVAPALHLNQKDPRDQYRKAFIILVYHLDVVW